MCESRRCRAELQRALLEKHEPCWQSCVGRAAQFPAPRCRPGYQRSLVSYSTSPKPLAVVDCNSYGSTVW